MKPQENPYIAQPVMKALSVLELVASRGHDVSLATVTKELKLPKTTAYRYLQTLTQAGFLRHDMSNNKYGVGARFHAIAKADRSVHMLRKIARPIMLELVMEFNETVNLGMAANGWMAYLDIIEANRSLRIQGRIGDRHYLHSTALGKAILAALPERERQNYITRPLVAMTSRTLTENDVILRQLRQAANLGYATETEENEDGAVCVGAAILDDIHYPIAAISVSAPRQRISRDLMVKIGLRLVKATQQISADLSNFPSTGS